MLLSPEGESISSSYDGYSLDFGLWAKAVLQLPEGPVSLIWKEVGTGIPYVGARVVSGYFYADPNQFSHGSEFNPEVFVKAYIAGDGWCNIVFNHVTVDEIDLSSSFYNSGRADQTGTATLNNRLVEHQYNGVSHQ